MRRKYPVSTADPARICAQIVSGMGFLGSATVFKSNNHLYAQIINDIQGKTLASVSSLEKSFKDDSQKNRLALAEKLGKEIAKRSIENGVKKVTFDKGKYKYHGIIKALADAARSGGLDF